MEVYALHNSRTAVVHRVTVPTVPLLLRREMPSNAYTALQKKANSDVTVENRGDNEHNKED